MKIDLSTSENWDHLNQYFGANARVYRGLTEAVYELTVGTALFLRHKRSVVFIQGVSPVLHPVLPFFYKETYQVHVSRVSQIHSAIEFVDQLPKDVVLVAMVEDHPVTGELFPIIDEIDMLLSQKRILFLRISHSNFWHQELNLNPYTARVCSVGDNLAVANFGDKFKIPSLFSHNVRLKKDEVIHEFSSEKKIASLGKEKILSFENEMKFIGGRPFFDLNRDGMTEFRLAHRLFDRAVVEFPGIHGEMLIHRLGVDKNDVDTTNQCRWQTTQLFHQWWDHCPDLNVLRDLVIFSASWVSDEKNVESVKRTYQELLREQSW